MTRTPRRCLVYCLRRAMSYAVALRRRWAFCQTSERAIETIHGWR
jgi:hypothetical protein